MGCDFSAMDTNLSGRRERGRGRHWSFSSTACSCGCSQCFWRSMRSWWFCPWITKTSGFSDGGYFDSSRWIVWIGPGWYRCERRDSRQVSGLVGARRSRMRRGKAKTEGKVRCNAYATDLRVLRKEIVLVTTASYPGRHQPLYLDFQTNCTFGVQLI